jgi:HK97 family phage prohead protease
MSDRPKPGAVEDRTAPIGAPAVDGRRLRGRIPVGIESRDMGGWREVIDPGALDGANLDDLIATREHDRSKLLGRHPTTLTVESRDDGLHWAVELPDSPAGEDVRVAVERGDLRGSSWRQVVARDYWDGDVRHIAEISRLLDVTVTAAPAYAAAAAELRSQPDPATGQEDSTMAETAENTETATAVEPNTEDRAQPVQGGLRVEDNVTVTNEPARGLADEFRAAGFPGELATLSWQEYEDRAVTWTGSVDNVNKARGTAGPLGYDQRYVWPVVPRVGVDGGVTSVDVFTQSARSLATAANVVRAISAVTDKPESGSTLTIVTTPLHQVATVQSGIPNIYLETQGFSTTIENDLRLALSDGLDKLVLDKFVASGFQAPGTDNILVSIRKCITTLRAAGYAPDTLVLTPAMDETIDVMVSGISGGTADFVFAPGQFAPGTLFGLQRRVSKTVPAPVVFDSQAFGKLYASPVSLARFEEAAGKRTRRWCGWRRRACSASSGRTRPSGLRRPDAPQEESGCGRQAEAQGVREAQAG